MTMLSDRELLTEDAICPTCNRLLRNNPDTESYLMNRNHPHKFDSVGRMVFLAPYCVCRRVAPIVEEGDKVQAEMDF